MPTPSPRSAGILFAILPLFGAFGVGAAYRQPVIGLVGGLVLAALLATLFWAADRRR